MVQLLVDSSADNSVTGGLVIGLLDQYRIASVCEAICVGRLVCMAAMKQLSVTCYAVLFGMHGCSETAVSDLLHCVVCMAE